jgi:hypothetical protein
MLTNLSGTNFASYRVIVSNASGSITSAPVSIWPDSNGTGMPDWWQMQYFGNLNQLPTGDYDGDGVDNLDEYLEGTLPNNAASYNPRLYVQSLHGYVVASPAQPYYTMGQVVTLTAIPDSGQTFLGWIGDGSGPKPVLSLLMNSHKTIGATFGLTLPVALDNANLVWTTGGGPTIDGEVSADLGWYGQTEISEDGVGAAQSGFIVSPLLAPPGQQSWLQAVTNLAQPMQLSFWWNVSSQPPDCLSFSVDGVTTLSISGVSAGWQQVQTNLPAGPHTLMWTYSKTGADQQNANQSVFLNVPWVDAGWVDEVALTPTSAPPVFQSATQAGGLITLTWSALSGRAYQLQYNTNLNLTNWIDLTNVTATSSTATASDFTAPDPQRFYRVVLLP